MVTYLILAVTLIIIMIIISTNMIPAFADKEQKVQRGKGLSQVMFLF